MVSHIDIVNAMSIGGWMSECELMWLATMAGKHKNIVEFGSLHGRSTRALADNMMDNGVLWAVDPWSGDYIGIEGERIAIETRVMPEFIHNLKDHIVTGRVVPVRNFSYRFSLPDKVDMVFIDGDHRYETVVRDIEKAYELLKSDGLICGHDYNHPGWPGVKEAVDMYVGPVEIIDTIWFQTKR